MKLTGQPDWPTCQFKKGALIDSIATSGGSRGSTRYRQVKENHSNQRLSSTQGRRRRSRILILENVESPTTRPTSFRWTSGITERYVYGS